VPTVADSRMAYPANPPVYNQPDYNQPNYNQPAYVPPANQPDYNQPAYVPPANQPAYVPPANQPYYPPTQPNYPATQPAYPATQPAYPATQPGYPTYSNTLPPPVSVNNGVTTYPQGTYPQNTYPQNNYPQDNIDLGQGGYVPANPQPGYAQPNYPPIGSQVAGYRTIRIPSNVIVPVTMDTPISSATARVGQTFTATVVSERIGDSEFPAGTKIEGMVTEARPKQGDQPGVLDLDFRTALLPDGTTVPLEAQLSSMDSKDITQSNGRIVAKAGKGQSTGDKLKVVGIGAGLGFVLGKVLDKNTTLTTILGAAGGYLYGNSRDKKASEAVVARGTKLGVRLNRAVAYNDRNGYADYRAQYLRS